jgi:hypothetical protein
LKGIKAESISQNRWPDDLATYLEASQTKGILLGGLADITIGHVLAAIYKNGTGWVGLFGKRTGILANGAITLTVHTL